MDFMSKKSSNMAVSKEDLLDLFARLRKQFDDHDLVYEGAASDSTFVEVPTPLLDLERRATAEDASISKTEINDALPALRDLLKNRLSAHEAARTKFYASKAAAFKAMEQQQASLQQQLAEEKAARRLAEEATAALQSAANASKVSAGVRFNVTWPTSTSQRPSRNELPWRRTAPGGTSS